MVTEKLRLDNPKWEMPFEPRGLRSYGNMTAQERLELWATIRKDSVEAAGRHPRQRVCGPCAIGLHDVCVGCSDCQRCRLEIDAVPA